MRNISRLSLTALLVLAVFSLSPSGVRAQQPFRPKRVLVLYWDEKDHPANVEFESQFQSALRSAARGPIELYSEFLESNRFPEEHQSELLRDFIRRKYAGRTIDIVVATGPAPLDFLFKYRSDLFPHTPIVFSATDYPSAAQLRSGAGATGILIANTYRKTLDLALRLHPDTQQVFVVSGTMARDRFFEKAARSQLDGYGSKAAIKYLTDLSLEELKVSLSNLPERSIVLYVWDWARNTEGKFLESREILNLIAHSARVPFYGMSFANVGFGIVGGYVWTMETTTARLAQLIVKVAYGARASGIPVESAPDVPMFDWSQLQRWNIREDRLPENSIIRFRKLTLWLQYKWYVIGTIFVVELETLLIGMLLIQHSRAREGAAALVKTQAVLRESEERFRNMANTAPVKIVVTDANRQATFFNKRWLDFTGRPIEQELGQGWASGVHPDDRDECLSKLWASQKARVEFRLEYRLRRADGQYRSIFCHGVPRFESAGAFVGYVESGIDITELKQVLALQKLESLGVLASGIAHDFNNLLGGILAGSELLLSDLAGASPDREMLENIKVTATRASEIVRQLMVYAGEESAVLEEVDLAELVREMLHLMMISITKNAALKIDVPGNAPPIRANKSQMRQVVMNLVTNASDALGDKGGTISVSLKHVRRQPESVLNKAPGEEFLRLEVRDSGCGMSEEIQARIFDPFFSTKRSGRGMGLAAVQGIIQSHGGTIEVQSALGSGSCFEILLPCVQQSEIRSSEHLISGTLSGDENVPATVLMIDDEETLRLPIARMLRRKGFSILDTGDGVTGLDIFQARATEIDIVLLDLTLPGMSGGEVLEGLRKVRPDIKVVVSTAYGRDRALAALSDPKSVYYLRKPYEIQELTGLLRKVLLNQEVQRAGAN